MSVITCTLTFMRVNSRGMYNAALYDNKHKEVYIYPTCTGSILSINNRCHKCFALISFIFGIVLLGYCITSTRNSYGKRYVSNSNVTWKIWEALSMFWVCFCTPFPLCTTDPNSAVEEEAERYPGSSTVIKVTKMKFHFHNFVLRCI